MNKTQFSGSSVANSVIFEGSEATNVTAYFGSTAILSCKIRNNLEDNPVKLDFNHSQHSCNGKGMLRSIANMYPKWFFENLLDVDNKIKIKYSL